MDRAVEQVCDQETKKDELLELLIVSGLGRFRLDPVLPGCSTARVIAMPWWRRYWPSPARN